jgi:hypothetical protein
MLLLDTKSQATGEMMMKYVQLVATVMAIALASAPAVAQQPGGKRPEPARAGQGMMMEQVMRLDSLDARLDSLVGQMHTATGNRKVAAMAAVIDELASQQKAMHQHMRQMMHSGMMQMMQGEGERDSTVRPVAPIGADSADHAKHHPPP